MGKKPADTELLLEAAKAKNRMTSTLELSLKTKSTQQTVSRKLQQMEKDGYIRRTVTPKGQTIELTEKGAELLQKQYAALKETFEAKKKTEVKGNVESGLQEGKYYMSLPQYREQMEAKLGFAPFAGTLNIRAEADAFAGKEPIWIEGFATKDRSYGRIRCYKAKIGKIEGAVIFPERAHRAGVIEVIAPVELRKKMGLKNGDLVKIEVI